MLACTEPALESERGAEYIVIPVRKLVKGKSDFEVGFGGKLFLRLNPESVL